MPLSISLVLGAILLFSGCPSCEQVPEDDPGNGSEEDVGVGGDTDLDDDAGLDDDGAFDDDVDGDVGVDGGDVDTDGDSDGGGDADAGQSDTGESPCGGCSSLDDQCNVGVCHEDSGTCVKEPANVGADCDDGLYCTVDEKCSAHGECVGQPRDCSELDELCRIGVCRENGKGCVAVDKTDKAPCDTGQFCVVDEKCSSGECVGTSRDCSFLDGQCHEGICDESAAKCVEVYVCGDCEDGIPIADAGADQESVPNTEVALDASGSHDPNGQALSYQWYIASKPDGSSTTISDPTSVTPTMLADIAGVFEICLTVTNEEQCSSEKSCMTVTVVPLAELHIELVWRIGADPQEEPIDLDLHYRTPDGTWFSGHEELPCRDPDNQADSVWWCVPNPDWGGGADGSEPDGISENDPLLDVDNLVGDGPENINQDLLFDGQGFRVGVHNFRDHGHGPEEARVRIYVNGELEFEAFETIECMMFWEVAELNISNGGTQVEIIPLDEEHFQGPVGYCGE